MADGGIRLQCCTSKPKGADTHSPADPTGNETGATRTVRAGALLFRLSSPELNGAATVCRRRLSRLDKQETLARLVAVARREAGF